VHCVVFPASALLHAKRSPFGIGKHLVLGQVLGHVLWQNHMPVLELAILVLCSVWVVACMSSRLLDFVFAFGSRMCVCVLANLSCVCVLSGYACAFVVGCRPRDVNACIRYLLGVFNLRKKARHGKSERRHMASGDSGMCEYSCM